MKTILTTGAIMMAMAIGLGALGAHAFENVLSDKQMDAYDTASLYLLIQSLGVLIISVLPIEEKGKKRICWLLITGILLFSGSIYLLSMREVLGISRGFKKILGPITPIGGMLLIISWILLALKIVRNGLVGSDK